MTDKELLRILSTAIKDTQTINNPDEGYYCPYCHKKHSVDYDKYPHEKDCPVLLAEEVLRDCQKCIHVGFKNKCNCTNGSNYQIKCTACNGSGRYDRKDSKGRGIKCSSCNGTGVEK